MADKNIGKITQVIGAVLDLKFSEGYLPEINDAVEITRKDGGKLVVEVAQHLGDDITSSFPSLVGTLIASLISGRLPSVNLISRTAPIIWVILPILFAML